MILPIKESVIFDERFHGMEVYCPVDEESNMFHRIKILDHTRYLINGQETMVYGAGGNHDYICIGVTDRELGRSVDMRFNLHTIEYNTKGFEIHVKEPQR